MSAKLLSVPLEFMGECAEDPRREYILVQFLKARDVENGKRTTHRSPFLSVHTALLLEIAGPRRVWNERLLRDAWRQILKEEPNKSKLHPSTMRRRLRMRWLSSWDNPWLSGPLVRLRKRCRFEAKRFPDAFTATSRVFLEYALLVLLTTRS